MGFETNDSFVSNLWSKTDVCNDNFNNQDKIKPEHNNKIISVFEKSKNNKNNAKFQAKLTNNSEILLYQAKEYAKGNFRIINNIKNPLLLIEQYKTISGGKSLFSNLFTNYRKGKLSKKNFLYYLNILSLKFQVYENKLDPEGKLKCDECSYRRIYTKVKEYYEEQEILKKAYDNNKFSRNQILEMQKFLKEECKIEMSEYDISVLAYIPSAEKFVTKDDTDCFKFDIDKFKHICLKDNLYTDYIKSMKLSNLSFDTIYKFAENVENEYKKYNFDKHNSKIADLVIKSEKMIAESETNIQTVKTDEKIILKNTSNNEERILDLKLITSNLDENYKTLIFNLIEEMNKLVLWEMAAEVKNSLKCGAYHWSGGQYYIDDDYIGINPQTDTYSLTHEIIHAIMATVIDGKNQSNEVINKDFYQAYKKEQTEYKTKGLIEEAEGYTYCAENIFEFAAEAGCLYLTGYSESAYTIAEHFPESYRMFVVLFEKIRNQKSNRTINS